MTTYSKTDRSLIFTLMAASFAGCIIPYVCGRFGVFLVIPPWLVAPLLGGIIGLIFIGRGLSKSLGGSQFQHLVARVAIVFALLFFPAWKGFDLFKRGRIDHIRKVFSNQVITDLRASAMKKFSTAVVNPEVQLTNSDLPAAVAKGFWGYPGIATVTKSESSAQISLTWGSPLIGHHGTIVAETEEPPMIPPQPSNENGETLTYLPWYSNSYIMYDTD